MNKYILSLVVTLSLVTSYVSVDAMIHAPLNDAQKAILTEYFESNKEETVKKAKQVFDLILEIVPEFYLTEFMFAPEKVLKTLEVFFTREELMYHTIEDHPELQTMLEKYYDETICKDAFERGFNTAFTWEQFQIMYMYTFAIITKDEEFRNAFLEASIEEAKIFADYFIALAD